MRSGSAVIAQYGLGAALSCDALGWKQAAGRETLGRCFPHRGAALGGIEGSAVLGVGNQLDKGCFKRCYAAFDVAEFKAWGRDGWLSPTACYHRL